MVFRNVRSVRLCRTYTVSSAPENVQFQRFDESQFSTSYPDSPPGSHDCGYYWYLDATEQGVARVLSPALAADSMPFLEEYEVVLGVAE